MTEMQSNNASADSKAMCMPQDQQNPDIKLIEHWSSPLYKGDMPPGDRFLMSVVDRRDSNGQLFVDVGGEDGDIDNILTASFEISNLPGSRDHTQVLHLHISDDELGMTIFKQGDRYILRPETGMTIRPTVLPNGERAFILGAEQ
ncbi:hypothetical protein [Hydrogenophaga sp. PBL-H3]|jgi:hypothetical protein|uniref:hypothetical protein n=1 Tax=Hydrogenophaga sp. PBL-H3 TaxID=434010 RepID=UPI00131FFC5C|nr:hypothetical protein [Hydrogenophaga sp. PBL-H3]QHE78807.1 hypothetical protein F9Z45_22035 [Hydrogenophaga sp. PBL-H3]QHE83232.1 hypothetical protein F9Z44_22035 [Hydrogenophaga sp. PBL-H3]